MTILGRFVPSPSSHINEANHEANLCGNLGSLLRLVNAHWVSVHEVDVRMSMGERVPLGRLEKLLYCMRTVYFVQPVPGKWNIVIVEVRHEQQIFPRQPVNFLMHTAEM
jgi:hypothetical protein